MFSEKISMSNWDTGSQTVKDEVKTEVIDHVIKKEIKTELEEVSEKTHGFICPTCKAHFLYDEFFIEHIKEHHKDVTVEKVNCYELMSSFGLSEKENNSNYTPHGCEPFKCSICLFSCSCKSRLLKHKRIHSKEKSFKCEQCSYACSQKGKMIQHQRIHTVEKPYKCNECSFSCSRKGDLVRHQRIHSGEKPYKCKECLLSFTRNRLSLIMSIITRVRNLTSVINVHLLVLEKVI